MYIKTDNSIWTGRLDDEHDRASFRYHQIVQVQTVDEVTENGNPQIALMSFKCDEGVRRNGGRLGAAEGPESIKSALSSVPWRHGDIQLADVGIVQCEGEKLEEAQQELGTNLSKLLQKGDHTIILGGGHETLYGNYLGVRAAVGPDAKLGIINIDAHFDLRKYDVQQSSGTMFNQILTEDEQAGYMVLGIQEFGNTTELFERADRLGVQYILEEDLVALDERILDEKISNFIAEYDTIIFTLCMDVLAADAAPGVSAPSPFGLQPTYVRKLIKLIVKHEKVKSFDICEVNPTFDQDNKTAKLAAYFVNEVIGQFAKNV